MGLGEAKQGREGYQEPGSSHLELTQLSSMTAEDDRHEALAEAAMERNHADTPRSDASMTPGCVSSSNAS